MPLTAPLKAQTPLEDNDAFAAALWQSLDAAGLVGGRAFQSKPYPGRRPHGAVLQVFYTRVDNAETVVLRNYGGAGVGVQAVAEQPRRYLRSISVVHKRVGDNPQNWVWAEYRPDGALARKTRNASDGCIACHANAGRDRLFGR